MNSPKNDSVSIAVGEMKIKDYNDAIEFFRTNDYQAADGAWSEFYQSEVLEPRIMDQASLADDLEPGSLKDEMLKDFDPSQETYEEYLQRKRLGERPFNMAEGGMIGKPGGIVEPGVKYYGKYIPHSSPKDKVVLTVQDHANTSAASIPLALDQAVRDGRIKKGDLLLMEAMGGGLTWGAALARW